MPKSEKKPRVSKGQPSIERTARRRELVGELWVQGYRYSEIVTELEDRLGESWTRQTVANDVRHNRAKWEEEAGTSATQHREELCRMAREIFRAAMRQKKVQTRRETGENGKTQLTSVLVPNPDLQNANKAVERLASLRGLNVTTIEGSLSIPGVADLVAELSAEVE